MTKAKHWILARRPEGNDYKAALELMDENLPPLQEGQYMIKSRVLSMDSGTRMWMTAREDSYSPPLPLGSKILGTSVGEVVQSRHPEYEPGDIVRCYGTWSDYCIIDPREVYSVKVENPIDTLRDYVGIYGANGWTAYVGVIEVGRVKPSETFLVSAAAGCTGIMAGQVAKLAGCKVIGICGSDKKGGVITSDYGFDGFINYKTQNVEAAISELCPEGVDVYFDNVGGPTLDAAIANMALFGRIPVCGLITSYISDVAVPGPSKFDQVLMKRLRIEGFFSPDFYHRGPDINQTLTKWDKAGQLKLPFDVVTGLENTVSAYSKLFTGTNIGKVVVEL